MPLGSRERLLDRGRAQRDSLIQLDPSAQDGSLPDHDARAVIDREARTDLCRGMDVDPGLPVPELAQDPRKEWNVKLVQRMSYPIKRDREEAGIRQDNLVRAVGRRVPLVHRIGVSQERVIDARQLRKEPVYQVVLIDHLAQQRAKGSLFGGDVAGVRLSGGPPVPPFVPPELQIEEWLGSIERMKSLGVSRLYLPHFGLVEGDLAPHFGALAERVQRWAEWFRDQLRRDRTEAEMIADFAQYETQDILAAGAPNERLADYERADPSFMAVGASIRYWQKFHPEAL